MRIILLLSIALALSPVSRDYASLIKEARDCFESGRHLKCDSLLTELRGYKLKRLQRRKVCTLWLDNTYHTGRHEEFMDYPREESLLCLIKLREGIHGYWSE